MTLHYLLDTNIILEPLKKPANQNLLGRLRPHIDDVAISATVWHELWYGCQRLPSSRRRSELEHYLNQMVAMTMLILPYDSESAAWFAAERARLVSEGRPPTIADGQIAAVAAVNGLTLVTRNVADFAQFQGLTIENWFEPTP